MLNLIYNALSIGYTAKQILDFIGKKVDKLDKGINEARSYGNSDDQILNFISGKIPRKNYSAAQKTSNDFDKYLSGVGLKNKEEKQVQRNKGINTALAVAGAGLGAYGAYKQYAKGLPTQEWDFNNGTSSRGTPNTPGHTIDISPKQLGHGNPPRTNPNPLPGSNPPKIGPPTPRNAPPVINAGFQRSPAKPGNQVHPDSMVNPGASNNTNNLLINTNNLSPSTPIPQPQTATNLPVNTRNSAPEKIPAKEILDQLGQTDRVSNMLQAGNQPADVAGALGTFLRPEQRKWIEKQGIPLDQVIEEFSQENQSLPFDQNVSNSAPEIEPSLDQSQSDTLAKPANLLKFKVGDSVIHNEYGEPGIISNISDKGYEVKGKDMDYLAQEDEIQSHVEPKKDLASTVMLPDGKIGTVKKKGKDHSVVEINGKDVPVKDKDLTGAPEDFYKFELDLRNIPEELKSSALYNVNTDPDQKSILVNFFNPLDKNQYRYSRKDGSKIDDDTINRIQVGLDFPNTKGIHWGGSHDPNKGDSRGHTVWEIKESAEEITPEKFETGGDPKKEFWFVKYKNIYTHPHQQKVDEKFSEKNKEFNKWKKSQ